MLLRYAWLTSLGGLATVLGITKWSLKSSFNKRKLCHFGSGTVMMLCWPLFPAQRLVHLAAASVPFLGIVKDPKFVKSVGHEEGKEHMLLLGPVQYGVCITVLTAAAFRTPLSVIPTCVLCAGDAAAGMWGFHKGKKKLPWNKSKTFEGMVAFVVGSSAVTLGMLYYLERADVPGWLSRSNFAAAVVASIVGAIVETTPPVAGVGNPDNVLVPLSSVAICAALGAY